MVQFPQHVDVIQTINWDVTPITVLLNSISQCTDVVLITEL